MTTQEAERIAAESPAAVEILTLQEALDLQPTYSPHTLVCLRGPNQRLLEEAATHAGGSHEHDIAVLFVEEVPGLFVPRDTQPSREAREVLADAVAWLNARGAHGGSDLAARAGRRRRDRAGRRSSSA